MNYWSFSAYVKHRVKEATNAISNFESSLTKHAREKGCQGVICGHIHTPIIIQQNGVTYYNTGDWVENCSALVEYKDGTLEILRRPTSLEQQYLTRLEAAPMELGLATGAQG
jgi:UDP-2,3-diacylglucosamine pyrophosphatase LpxH